MGGFGEHAEGAGEDAGEELEEGDTEGGEDGEERGGAFGAVRGCGFFGLGRGGHEEMLHGVCGEWGISVSGWLAELVCQRSWLERSLMCLRPCRRTGRTGMTAICSEIRGE